MHACIAAISQSVPAVSIAYSRKFRGVMDTLGMGEYVADPRTMTDEEIFELINKAYFERSSTREKLEKEMPKIKMKVLDLFKEIWDELSNKRTR